MLLKCIVMTTLGSNSAGAYRATESYSVIGDNYLAQDLAVKAGTVVIYTLGDSISELYTKPVHQGLLPLWVVGKSP